MTFTPHDLDPCPICKNGILHGVYAVATCDNCKRSFGLAVFWDDEYEYSPRAMCKYEPLDTLTK